MVAERPQSSITDGEPRPAVLGSSIVPENLSASELPELPEESHWISDDTLFHLQRCQRRAFLDRHGVPDHQHKPSEYLLKLRQDSRLHRQRILKTYDTYQRPRYPKGDWRAGTRATLALMRQRVPCIYKGVLIGTSLDDPTQAAPTQYYRSQPDLLLWQPSESADREGHEGHYVPIDIRLGKKPKPEYQLVVAFHALLLAAYQDVMPDHGWLMLKEKRHRVDLSRQLPLLFDALAACDRTFTSDSAPEVFISRSRCDMCLWLPHCYDQAKTQQHLSLLPGITLNRYRRLKPLGLTSVTSIATLTPPQLAHITGFEQEISHKLVTQARATEQGNAIARQTPFPLNPADLPSAPYELYFDIEAAPDKDLVYLHGVLVVETATGSETFIPLVAEQPDEEARAWLQFQYVMAEYPDAPVYHFCPYEAQTVRRLAQTYGTIIDIEGLLSRFVDIHQRVTVSVVLPVESYALKPIARWMGFDWRDEEANGAQSICWYDNWIVKRDRTYLDLILRYNEDDCRATYRVKQWLTTFAQDHWQPVP